MSAQGDEVITKLEKKLKSLRVPYSWAGYSKAKGKRFAVIVNDKIINFGDPKATTYFDNAPEEKRQAYIARHSKIRLKDGTRAIDARYSPAWLSFFVLWS